MGHQSEISAICRPIRPSSLFWFSTQEKISGIGFFGIFTSGFDALRRFLALHILVIHELLCYFYKFLRPPPR